MKLIKALTSLILSTLIGVPAFATAPKEVCRIQKELRAVTVGAQTPTRIQAFVTLEFDVRKAGLQKTETFFFDLSPEVAPDGSLTTGTRRLFANETYSLLYDRNLRSVKTQFYELKSDGRAVLLFEELDKPQAYSTNGERPLTPVSCFQYAN
mgnify:CR=1 FL=1